MDFVFKIVQILICILEAYLVIDFFSAFFRLRGTIDRRYTKTGLILVMAVCVNLINLQNSTTFNVTAMFFIYGAAIIIFFQGKLLKKFLYYITAMIIMVGSEFLGIILLSLQTDFSLRKVESNQIIVNIAMLSLKFLAFVLFSIAKKITRGSDNRRIDFKIMLLYSIVPMALIGMMIAITRLNIDFTSMEYEQILLIVSSILVLVGSVAIFYIFDRYSQFMWKLKQQELMIAKLEIEEKHYEEIEQVNREQAAFLHDIRQYMRTIGEMAVDSDNEAIQRILSELQIKVSVKESEMLCSNRIINTILNEKKKDAERKKVNIKIVVEPNFSVNQISDVDLIVIIGNLLDNAVEAAENCEEGYVRVWMFPQNDNHFSVIKVVNNYVGEINEEDDRLLTVKEDKEKHGFGLRNVYDIAEKCGGYLQYFYKNGEFTAVVILPLITQQWV